MKIKLVRPVHLASILLLFGALGTAWAQYGGVLVSATPQTPIQLGEGLNITVVVYNDTGDIWEPGYEYEFSWMAAVYDMSWNPGRTLSYYATWSVEPEATDTVTLTVDPADLPTAPGNYSLSIYTAFNWWDLVLSLMEGSPKTVNFTIAGGNQPPVITPIGDKTIVETNLLSFTVSATDPDVPSQTLSFSLAPGAPEGAGISSAGLFTWTPPAGYAPHTNQISVVVTDSGSPPLSATNTFNVVVLKPVRFLPPAKPVDGVLTLRWESFPGKTYRVRYRDDLVTGSWLNLGDDIVADDVLTSTTANIETSHPRFFQLLLLD